MYGYLTGKHCRDRSRCRRKSYGGGYYGEIPMSEMVSGQQHCSRFDGYYSSSSTNANNKHEYSGLASGGGVSAVKLVHRSSYDYHYNYDYDYSSGNNNNNNNNYYHNNSDRLIENKFELKNNNNNNNNSKYANDRYYHHRHNTNNNNNNIHNNHDSNRNKFIQQKYNNNFRNMRGYNENEQRSKSLQRTLALADIPLIQLAQDTPKSPSLSASKARFDLRKNFFHKSKSDDRIYMDISDEECSTTTANDIIDIHDNLRDRSSKALLKAIKDEDSSAVLQLLETEFRGDVNATDNRGRTALSYAVLKCNIPLVEKLLRVSQIDVNKADNEGNTPLHFAAQAGQTEAISLMLNGPAKVEIDARNHLGFTPLMKAALQGRTRCAKILLFTGASPTMRDTGKGLRAEQWARYCGRYTCADMIEKYARHELLSKTTSYGHWGSEPELGPHMVNGKLQPPAVTLQNVANQKSQKFSIKSKLKKVLHPTSSGCNGNSKCSSFSLVTHLTSAALCVSSPVLPNNSNRVPPIVKSLIKPLVIPKIEITPDMDTAMVSEASKQKENEQKNENHSSSAKPTSSIFSNSKSFQKRIPSCIMKLKNK